MVEIQEKHIEAQEEVEELVKFVGNKITKIAEKLDGDEERLLLDFIGNLIDYKMGEQLGALLFTLYTLGQITKEEVYKAIDVANIRPRYKKRMYRTMKKLIGDKDVSGAEKT